MPVNWVMKGGMRRPGLMSVCHSASTRPLVKTQRTDLDDRVRLWVQPGSFEVQCYDGVHGWDYTVYRDENGHESSLMGAKREK